MSATLPLKTGGPAYPNYPSDSGKYGLSVLDWFAGQALSGLCANPQVITAAFITTILGPQVEPLEEPIVHTDTEVDPETLSQIAYTIAAEMIELRDLVPIDPPPVPIEETAPVDEQIAPPLPGAAIHGTVHTTSGPNAPAP